jgi:hypothetical protein
MKEEKLTYEIDAYCVKCKDKRTMVEGLIKTSDSGRRMAVGKCLACGTKVNRILGRLVPISRPVTPHDKLLTKLVQAQGGPVYQALREAVKLHKPFMGNTFELCKECNQARKAGDPVIIYPCPTIQAIESELS